MRFGLRFFAGQNLNAIALNYVHIAKKGQVGPAFDGKRKLYNNLFIEAKQRLAMIILMSPSLQEIIYAHL